MKKSQLMSTQESSVLHAFYSFYILDDFNVVKHHESLIYAQNAGAHSNYLIPNPTTVLRQTTPENEEPKFISELKHTCPSHIDFESMLFFCSLHSSRFKNDSLSCKAKQGRSWPLTSAKMLAGWVVPSWKSSRQREFCNYANQIKIAVWSFKLWRAEWKKNTTEF